MKAFLFRWSAQGSDDIELEPVDAAAFLRLLWYLSGQYGFALPRIVDTLEGYAADFVLAGSPARLTIDTWSFSLHIADEAVRDRVLAELRALPPEAFEEN